VLCFLAEVLSTWVKVSCCITEPRFGLCLCCVFVYVVSLHVWCTFKCVLSYCVFVGDPLMCLWHLDVINVNQHFLFSPLHVDGWWWYTCNLLITSYSPVISDIWQHSNGSAHNLILFWCGFFKLRRHSQCIHFSLYVNSSHIYLYLCCITYMWIGGWWWFVCFLVILFALNFYYCFWQLCKGMHICVYMFNTRVPEAVTDTCLSKYE
jgi:hypothetical protein